MRIPLHKLPQAVGKGISGNLIIQPRNRHKKGGNLFKEGILSLKCLNNQPCYGICCLGFSYDFVYEGYNFINKLMGQLFYFYRCIGWLDLIVNDNLTVN